MHRHRREAHTSAYPCDRIVHMEELQAKGSHYERLDDSRGARGNVRNRLDRERHHRHWLGLRWSGHRQHGPRSDQGRIRRGAPDREQAESRRQRRPGFPLCPFHGAGVDRRHVRPRRAPLPYRRHQRPLRARARAQRHHVHARRHMGKDRAARRARAGFQKLTRWYPDPFRHLCRGHSRPGVRSRP